MGGQRDPGRALRGSPAGFAVGGASEWVALPSSALSNPQDGVRLNPLPARRSRANGSQLPGVTCAAAVITPVDAGVDRPGDGDSGVAVRVCPQRALVLWRWQVIAPSVEVVDLVLP